MGLFKLTLRFTCLCFPIFKTLIKVPFTQGGFYSCFKTSVKVNAGVLQFKALMLFVRDVCKKQFLNFDILIKELV